MPKEPPEETKLRQGPDETKLRRGDEGPGPLSTGLSRFPAASDSPRFEHDVPSARAPKMMAKRGGAGGLILVLVVLSAAAGAVWYFLLR